MADFPRVVGGRITNETGELIDHAETRFGVTEGALVRMALEDFLPRFIANRGSETEEHVQLVACLSAEMKKDESFKQQVSELLPRAVRRRLARA
jgi:hypothetical protein